MRSGDLLASVVLATGLSTAPAFAQTDVGLMTVESRHSAAETLSRLEGEIRAKGMKVFSLIDHAAAAKDVGIAMPPTTVVIFGNPKGGSPNMIKQPTLAIDLPLKALVWQDAGGKVYVTYNSGAYVLGTIFPRHGLNPPTPAQQKQEAMLSGLAAAAAN